MAVMVGDPHENCHGNDPALMCLECREFYRQDMEEFLSETGRARLAKLDGEMYTVIEEHQTNLPVRYMIVYRRFEHQMWQDVCYTQDREKAVKYTRAANERRERLASAEGGNLV